MCRSRFLIAAITCLMGLGLLFPSACLFAQENDRITNENFFITYSVYARANDTMTVVMTRISGDLNPFLALQDSVGTYLMRAPADTSGWQATMTYTFAKEGNYYVVASRLDAEVGTTTGDFILEIKGVQSTGPYAGTAAMPLFKSPMIVLFPRQPLDGKVSNNNFVTYYLVYINQESQITGRMERLDGDLKPSLVLFDSNSKIIIRGSSEEDFSEVNATVLQTGWYVLAATRFDVDLGTTTGEYRIFFDITNISG